MTDKDINAEDIAAGAQGGAGFEQFIRGQGELAACVSQALPAFEPSQGLQVRLLQQAAALQQAADALQSFAYAPSAAFEQQLQQLAQQTQQAQSARLQALLRRLQAGEGCRDVLGGELSPAGESWLRAYVASHGQSTAAAGQVAGSASRLQTVWRFLFGEGWGLAALASGLLIVLGWQSLHILDTRETGHELAYKSAPAAEHDAGPAHPAASADLAATAAAESPAEASTGAPAMHAPPATAAEPTELAQLSPDARVQNRQRAQLPVPAPAPPPAAKAVDAEALDAKAMDAKAMDTGSVDAPEAVNTEAAGAAKAAAGNNVAEQGRAARAGSAPGSAYASDNARELAAAAPMPPSSTALAPSAPAPPVPFPAAAARAPASAVAPADLARQRSATAPLAERRAVSAAKMASAAEEATPTPTPIQQYELSLQVDAAAQARLLTQQWPRLARVQVLLPSHEAPQQGWFSRFASTLQQLQPRVRVDYQLDRSLANDGVRLRLYQDQHE